MRRLRRAQALQNQLCPLLKDTPAVSGHRDFRGVEIAALRAPKGVFKPLNELPDAGAVSVAWTVGSISSVLIGQQENPCLNDSTASPRSSSAAPKAAGATDHICGQVQMQKVVACADHALRTMITLDPVLLAAFCGRGCVAVHVAASFRRIA